MLSKKMMSVCLFCVVSCALANNGMALKQNQYDKSMVDFQQTVQDMRNNKVIYQELDTSCGGAALSMLLEYSLGIKTTEEEVINFVAKKRDFDAVNFKDMGEFAQSKGVEGYGQYADFNTMWDYINKRNVPFIVRIHAADGDKVVSQEDKYQFHFVVVKGIFNELVSISDPTPVVGGNIQYNKEEFLKMIKLKNGRAEIFFVIPKEGSTHKPNAEYTNKPERYPFENRMPRFIRF